MGSRKSTAPVWCVFGWLISVALVFVAVKTGSSFLVHAIVGFVLVSIVFVFVVLWRSDYPVDDLGASVRQLASDASQVAKTTGTILGSGVRIGVQTIEQNGRRIVKNAVDGGNGALDYVKTHAKKVFKSEPAGFVKKYTFIGLGRFWSGVVCSALFLFVLWMVSWFGCSKDNFVDRLIPNGPVPKTSASPQH